MGAAGGQLAAAHRLPGKHEVVQAVVTVDEASWAAAGVDFLCAGFQLVREAKKEREGVPGHGLRVDLAAPAGDLAGAVVGGLTQVGEVYTSGV